MVVRFQGHNFDVRNEGYQPLLSGIVRSTCTTFLGVYEAVPLEF